MFQVATDTSAPLCSLLTPCPACVAALCLLIQRCRATMIQANVLNPAIVSLIMLNFELCWLIVNIFPLKHYLVGYVRKAFSVPNSSRWQRALPVGRNSHQRSVRLIFKPNPENRALKMMLVVVLSDRVR